MKSYKYILCVLFFCCTSLALTAQQKKIVILHTSDTHSQMEPVNQVSDRDFSKGGAVRRTVLLEKLRKDNPKLLLFDCGDFSQGTPYYNMFKGDAEIDMMNLMKYDAVMIGNHEFDFGLENMARLFKRAKFPVVCSNYDLKGSVLEKIVKSYVIIVRNGVRIGVFGLGPQLEGLVQAKNYGSLKYEDPIAVSDKMVALLREKEKCDLVVCLSHLGINEDKLFIPQSHGIDVVLGGHSHTFLKNPIYMHGKDGKKVILLHSGRKGVEVGEVQVLLKEK
jgi:5'-nucleotidase